MDKNFKQFVISILLIGLIIIGSILVFNLTKQKDNVPEQKSVENVSIITEETNNKNNEIEENKEEEKTEHEIIDCNALEREIWWSNEANINYYDKEKLINKFFDNNCKRENSSKYKVLSDFAYITAGQTKDIQEKIKYYKIAYNNIKQDPNNTKDTESTIALCIGKQYQKLGEYNKALEWFYKVWNYYEIEKTKGTNIMRILPEHIGDALLLNGENEKAYQYYNEVLSRFENDNDSDSLEHYYRIKSKIEGLENNNIDYETIERESLRNWQ